ncbi:hypothetical protein N0V93_007675 [Gnomoniopsis smithogilvyi]|uniref:AAA+ ATPase domain-containing protein n=1 Tax=Gnomoniopsis smithogilvyi TaxID=1191159 RepID=A0A9W8YLJ9_9PEZI|nr:hypothetical protein N0V93_007675 [Gnomoniopsis smithogilvyi]
MDSVPQQATAVIREGDPSQSHPNKPDVKGDAVEPANANRTRRQESSKDANKKTHKKKKAVKKQADGDKAKKGKKKKQALPTDDSSDLSEDDDEVSSEEDSDGSEVTEPEEVHVHKRASKKTPIAQKAKSHKSKSQHSSKRDKTSRLKLLDKSPASDTSESDWDSSDSEDEVAEVDNSIIKEKKKAKDPSVSKEIRTQVAREMQRILQLAQSRPALPAYPGLGAGLGGGLDAGLGLAGFNYPQGGRASLSGYPSLGEEQGHSGRTQSRKSNGDTGDDQLLGSSRWRGGKLQTDNKHRDGGSAEPNEKSKKIDYKRVDQVWDNTIHNFKLQATAESNSEAKYDGFCFHVRRTFDWEGKYKATMVDIKSKPLRESLQDVIGNIKGVSLVDETPKLDPNILFLYLEDLRKHVRSLKKEIARPAGSNKEDRRREAKRLAEKRQHLKVLVRYLDKDYNDVKTSLDPMLEHGLITFDLLWALWKPNTLAYTTTYGSHDEPRVFKVETAEKHYHLTKGNFYYIDGKYFENDGKQFGYGHMMEEIPEFRGAKKITSLGCYPLKYHKNEEKLRKDLIERGKKFVTLSGVNYKSHQGMAYYKKKKNIIKVNVNGRVMIDPSIHRRINPNYPISLVRPKEDDIITDDEDSDECGEDDEDDVGHERDLEDAEEAVKYVTRIIKDDKGRLQVTRMTKEEAEELCKEKLAKVESRNESEIEGSDEEAQDAKKSPEYTEEEYLLASPVVLGFSFGEKLWLEFTVSGIKEISWNANAYESLVLEPKTKETVKALVESHKYHAAESIDDVIQGKGKGLVAVLHGPPGTGKTLTAEGISELLKCPLYMVSAGELGTDSRILEGELQRILDICHAWGAILLLDEADVFLEKRNMADIHRNALVSIFLRQLEYFQGILFLTTNRVETFDDAFQSRIHIALRYDPLDLRAKKTIFKMFVERARTQQKTDKDKIDFSDADYDTLARHDLNGRQIKNTVIRAQALAVNKGEPLAMAHVRQILDVQIDFQKDLKGGTGYQDAMRSYF